MIDWTEVILSIISAVLVPMVGFVVAALNKWLEAKAEQVKNQTESDVLDKYVAIAQQLTEQVVDYLNTTMVNDLKIAAEDGHLTEEEAADIMNNAKMQVLSLLGEAGTEALTAVYGDLDEILEIWITNATEKAKATTGLTSDQALQIASEKKVNPSKEFEDLLATDPEASATDICEGSDAPEEAVQ